MVFLLFAATSQSAQTATHADDARCVAEQSPDHYRCNRKGFQRVLSAAHNVRIDTDRLDFFAAGQVKSLIESLGKQIVTADQHADLVFDLAPVDRSGRIDFGPADVPLATLSVSDPAKGTGKRGLVWVETFDGSQDRPWPSVVTDLLRKFQNDGLAH